MSHLASMLWLGLLPALATAQADDPPFSGPQPGEKLTSLKVVGVFDPVAGKEFDVLTAVGGKPCVLIFCHELTRPSVALMRAIGSYAASRSRDGLQTYLIRLHGDRTEAATRLKAARGALPDKVPVVISLDGAEGPGAYGLNRKMGLTILVARDNKVTANFALVQPSVTDAAKIGEAIVKVVGGKAPTQSELEALATPGRAMAGERDPRLTELLRSVIRQGASEEQVRQAAAAVEKLVGEDARLQKQLGEVAGIGLRQKYGTEEAQKYLKTWADKYGPKDKR